MQNNNPDSISHYEIVKIQPNLITMRHKQTRKTYRYCQSKQIRQFLKIDCSSIIYPICIETGQLYEAGYMTLSSQIQTINKNNTVKCTFDQCQIVNTVEPIINTLKIMHSNGIVHEAITPSNIIVDEMGNLKLYYPGIKQNIESYYDMLNFKFEDDFKALARIILQLLGFSRNKQQDQLKILRLLSKSGKYSQVFIFTLLCMIQGNKKLLNTSLDSFLMLDGNNAPKLQDEAKNLYQNQILQKNKKQQPLKRNKQKIQFTPPLMKHSDHTPKKILQITKKYVKVQDCENKKYFQQNKKKKPTDQPLKRVSNSKNQDQNNIASPNYKKILRDIRQTKQKQDLCKMALNIKRMRTVSKKKVN